MIRKLTLGEPFISMDYIENEPEYLTGSSDLVFNLSRDQDITVENQILAPWHAAVFHGAVLGIPHRALIVKNYGTLDVENEDTAAAIKNTWPSVWELTHAERNRGVEYYKCPTENVGGDTNLNFCYGERQLAAGLHREHRDPDFDELHLQICGRGEVQIFREKDVETLYRSLPLAPGMANAPIWNSEGIYPWHRYYSESRCVFLVIEMDR